MRIAPVASGEGEDNVVVMGLRVYPLYGDAPLYILTSHQGAPSGVEPGARLMEVAVSAERGTGYTGGAP